MLQAAAIAVAVLVGLLGWQASILNGVRADLVAVQAEKTTAETRLVDCKAVVKSANEMAAASLKTANAKTAKAEKARAKAEADALNLAQKPVPATCPEALDWAVSEAQSTLKNWTKDGQD